MGTFFVLVIVFLVLKLIFSNKYRIDFKSFFKKGFKKIDSKFGIICYTAKQGMGKTYCAIKFVIQQLLIDPNIHVITNVKSFYLNAQRTLYGKRVAYSNNLLDIIKTTTSDTVTQWLVFYDEIFSLFDKNHPMPKRVRNYLSQLRKRKILFVTTAQEWAEINIGFRRYVRFHVVPRMFAFGVFRTAIIFKNVNDGDLIHWDNEIQDYVAPLIETQISKGNVDIIKMYDTFETIEAVDIPNV